MRIDKRNPLRRRVNARVIYNEKADENEDKLIETMNKLLVDSEKKGSSVQRAIKAFGGSLKMKQKKPPTFAL